MSIQVESKDGLWNKEACFVPRRRFEELSMSVELIHTSIGLTYLALWALIGLTTVRRRPLPRSVEPLEHMR